MRELGYIEKVRERRLLCSRSGRGKETESMSRLGVFGNFKLLWKFTDGTVYRDL